MFFHDMKNQLKATLPLFALDLDSLYNPSFPPFQAEMAHECAVTSI